MYHAYKILKELFPNKWFPFNLEAPWVEHHYNKPRRVLLINNFST